MPYGLRGEGLVYHSTCMRRSFMKSISEGLVAVITFDDVTSRHHVDVREEEDVFEHWSCVSCRKPLYDIAMRTGRDLEESLDLKLEHWCEKRNLCHRLETESWLLIL